MFESFSEWVKQPFRVDMSAQDWFLFIGFLLALLVIWSLILRTLKESLS